MPTLTIFTPTYNRAYCLEILYKSLVNQSSQDFEWLIIDDGSTDNTRQLVHDWIVEAKIFIRYIFKENGGMNTAHNLAYQQIASEINMCIDSDDHVPFDAVASVIECWCSVSGNPKVAGIVGLDHDLNGNLIGTLLPANGTQSKLGLLYQKEGISGDKKLVYRSSITKAYPPYPEFKGERLVPLGMLYTLIDSDYDIVCFNEVWVIVDYQPDGSSHSITKQYFQSPNGFREAKIIEIKNGYGFIYKLKCLVHFGFTSLILRDYKFFVRSPFSMLSLLLLPISLLVFFYQKAKLRQ